MPPLDIRIEPNNIIVAYAIPYGICINFKCIETLLRECSEHSCIEVTQKDNSQLIFSLPGETCWTTVGAKSVVTVVRFDLARRILDLQNQKTPF